MDDSKDWKLGPRFKLGVPKGVKVSNVLLVNLIKVSQHDWYSYETSRFSLFLSLRGIQEELWYTRDVYFPYEQ